jgi:beta-lactamase superfamily II metal-dependent hydrolase
MFRIHILDVGRGDAIILQFDNGKTYLIDSNEVANKATPFCYLTRMLGITKLETIVVTHQHIDHCRGLQEIIERIPVGQIWLAKYPHKTQAYQDLLATIRRKQNIRILFPSSGTFIEEDKDLVQILAPPPVPLSWTHSDINNNSIVLRVVIANLEKNTSTSVILGSDAELESWAHILSAHRNYLKADLLKVSHHGSNYGTYPDILYAIRPKYAVISVGDNPYGHPEGCALKFLEETCVRVFRTDRDGTCIFESDGVSWQCVS